MSGDRRILIVCHLADQRPASEGTGIGVLPYMVILTQLTADEVLDSAFAWLCKRRRNYPADADVWSFRQRWPAEKDRLKAELATGRFRFGLLTRITLKDGEEIDLWSARDALVLKALAIMLAKHLPVSTRCTQVRGHGGPRRGLAGARVVNKYS